MNGLEKILKRNIVGFLSIILFISSIMLTTSVTADAATKVNEKYSPSYGIEYKNVDYTKGSAKGRVNVMEMDVSDVFTEVQLGKAEPLDNLATVRRSEEHTSELQSRFDLVCRLLLEK